MADTAALERAILNLLDNAVKFSPPDGIVRIRQVVDGATVTVEVVDDGPGIDPAHLPYVFNRFWRAPESRSLPGSGLGLAIVHETATAHGGRIRLARAQHGGTVARLTLATIEPPPGNLLGIPTDAWQRQGLPPDSAPGHVP
jgi:two-component system sensor histidine kinase MprB